MVVFVVVRWRLVFWGIFLRSRRSSGESLAVVLGVLTTEKYDSCKEEDSPSPATTSTKRRLKEEGPIIPLRRSLRLMKSVEDAPMCIKTASKQRFKLPYKHSDRKPHKENVPFLRSRKRTGGRRLLSVEEFLRNREEVERRASRILTRETKYLAPEQLAKFALSDYNTKHGTDFEYVRLPHADVITSRNLGYRVDFVNGHSVWTHFNFEARRRNANPRDKPLLVFAEVYRTVKGYNLTKLSLVKDSNDASGCQMCCSSNILHPPHGFRAGFESSGAASDPEILSEEVAVKLSKFALKGYNGKNGTKLKFREALRCYRFTCNGLLMNFTEKITSWVHMNFVASVGPPKAEKCVLLFCELYLVDEDTYVLATLSPAAPSNYRGEDKLNGCRCCRDDMHHPWRGFHSRFSYRPHPITHPPTSAKVAACD